MGDSIIRLASHCCLPYSKKFINNLILFNILTLTNSRVLYRNYCTKVGSRWILSVYKIHFLPLTWPWNLFKIMKNFSFYFSISSSLQIIVERYYKEVDLPHLNKRKFLVPQELTMSQFVCIIRNRMKIGQSKALFLLVNNRSMISLSRTIAEIYSEHLHDDGFLYITYTSQEVFGTGNSDENVSIS